MGRGEEFDGRPVKKGERTRNVSVWTGKRES